MNQPRYEDLTIQNDFMFKKVMQSKRICKRLISEIMQVPIKDIVYIETEKAIEAYYDSKGIRLDVLIADGKGTHYNIEMQVKDLLGYTSRQSLLAKRSRYYQSIIDMDMLQKGQDYDELSPLFLIFICAFDLFGEARYVYTFKNRYLENLKLELENGVSLLFLNSLGRQGEVSPLVKNFLQYVNDHKPKDDFTLEIENEVIRLKHDKEVRREFMVLSTRLKDERMMGREEGRAEEKRYVVLTMLKKGYALEDIQELSQLSKNEILSIAHEENIKIKE